MLTRREHCESELRQKLIAKRHDANVVDAIVAELKAENLQSDERFADAYVYARTERGDGPLRITYELRKRGVAASLIERAVSPHSERWTERLAQLRQKRFGDAQPNDFKEWTRQANYLQRRGYSVEQIHSILVRPRRQA